MLKLSFKVSKEYDAWILARFVKSQTWSEFVFYHHPNLKSLIEKMGLAKGLKRYVNDYHKKNKSLIFKKKESLNEDWKKINDSYETALKNLLEVSGIFNLKVTCYVSICPINPRFLKEKIFSVYFKKNKKHSLGTVAHEVQHFYFFHKWRQVFPKLKAVTFESPHKIWHLSEILTPILLSSKNIQKLTKTKPEYYPMYKKIRIGNLDIVEHFSKRYSESMRKGTNFSDFLKNCYKEVNKIRFNK